MRLRVAAAVLTAVVLAAGGCARGADRAAERKPRSTAEADATAPPSGASSASASPGATPSEGDAASAAEPIEQLERLGRFYIVMGKEKELPYLHTLDWGSLEPKLVTRSVVVTNISACGDVVVATATSRQDGKTVANWLARVNDSRIEPIEGVGSTTGAPLGPDGECRFAFVVERGGNHVVRSWDPETGAFSDLFTTREPAGRVDWYGKELLVRVGTTDLDWRIVAVTGGKARDLDVDINLGDAFVAHPSGWLALSDPLKQPLRIRLQHLGDGRKLEVQGWTPVTWLPGEPRMLVRNADSLALLSVPSLDFSEIGAWTHDPIWNGAWAP